MTNFSRKFGFYLPFFIYDDWAFLKLLMIRFGFIYFYEPGNPEGTGLLRNTPLASHFNSRHTMQGPSSRTGERGRKEGEKVKSPESEGIGNWLRQMEILLESKKNIRSVFSR